MKELSTKHIRILDDAVDGSWSINPETGLIDVKVSVRLQEHYFVKGKLPVSFGVVSGNFDCSYTGLGTLEGCPYWVGGDFQCTHNELLNFKYAPNYIGGNSFLWNNSKLKELNWNPEHIGGGLYFTFYVIDAEFHSSIIHEIDALIGKGIKINPLTEYLTMKEAYYERKLIEVL